MQETLLSIVSNLPSSSQAGRQNRDKIVHIASEDFHSGLALV